QKLIIVQTISESFPKVDHTCTPQWRGPRLPSVDSMMYHVGYCTNVHAGATWQQTQENLEKYAARVRQIARPDSALGVGLWLSARAAAELTEAGGVEAFGQWLRHRRLVPYTMNGFPYGDF